MSQPKALYLADVLKSDPRSKSHHDEAAAELRRLHDENKLLHERHHFDNGVLKELLEALKNIEVSTYEAMTAALARAAIHKVWSIRNEQ